MLKRRLVALFAALSLAVTPFVSPTTTPSAEQASPPSIAGCSQNCQDWG